MVMLALIPYLALSAALGPITPIIAKQLHMSLQTMSLSSGLGNAAYAVGTVLAVQFAQHLPQRRMLLGYATLLVIGSLLAAAAQDPGMYIAGHVLQGLCTSLLLIAAVPPLALGYPTSKLRVTAMIMSMCIFGAVALGPTVGGLQAQAHAWRPLFFIIAAIAAMALILAVLTFDDAPPADPDSPRDLPAIALAAIGCFAAFIGASELLTHPFIDAETTLPLLGGLATIIVLIVYQFRAKRPLLTIKTMLTSSIPVAGIVVALFAAAASVSATALTAAALSRRYAPLHLGLLYLPELAGAVITAIILGQLLNKRAIQYLPLGGHGVPRSRNRSLPDQGPLEPGAHAPRVRADRHRPGSDGRARAVRRRLLPARHQPPARVRDRRADARGGGVHDRADLRPPRQHRRRQPRQRHQRRRCGSAWPSPSAAPSSASRSTRSAERARRRRTSTASWRAGMPAWYSPPLLAKLRRGLTAPLPATENAS